MKSFRNPEYLERYEDVVFDLEQALETPGNGAHQTKTGHSGAPCAREARERSTMTKINYPSEKFWL